ncbi:MAG: hypothetical protein ACI9WU_003000 [Myxococcota bacterium]|jgi:hypothetical protein
MQSKWIVLGVIAVLLAAGAWQYQRDRAQKEAAAEAAGECRPEGGLACDGKTVLVCRDGVPTPAGECPGGCVDASGVTRCLDTEQRLLGPEGAGCRPGMGLCGIQPNTLLVCREGRLVKGADCPEGCVDEGDRGGLYCLGPQETLRFPEGFSCPRFDSRKGPNTASFVCGADGTSLLRCQDDLLVAHEVTCTRCSQRKNGTLTCLDEVGDRIAPSDGAKLR